ncbi:DUF3880 domain-containing protein [Paenibacillus sp. N1-5-1-14]|uniref:CgeB family protein n=1 Tax=Paenibacillus radicibacter TaxID=2972488 RepID=UPI002158BD04|nr:DUF3880 domain-containing protein [Paenibacillus radicibacter]MCR8645199.1 DUF3880 domain-containing protein [Paenibacillus radicibacter]
MNASLNGAQKQELDFRTGYQSGYRLGCCEQIRGHHTFVPSMFYDKKILYIPQGFEAIDAGIIHGFHGIVKELRLGTPQETFKLAQSFEPDLVLVLNGLHVFPKNHCDQIDQVRSLGIQTAIWFADDPYYMDVSIQIAPHYDYVFTHEQSCVQHYQLAGCREVHYLPLAVNNSIYRPIDVSESYRSDICFIGNAFPNRIAFFNQLVPYLAQRKVFIIGSLWDRLKQYKRLASKIHLSWVPIEETVKFYNGAKVVINLHRAPFDAKYNRNSKKIPARSTNPRTYEISACATVQLTDIRADLPSLYRPTDELDTYQTAEELIHKTEMYLHDEELRNRVALRGYNCTIRDHIFPKRLEQMMRIVFKV